MKIANEVGSSIGQANRTFSVYKQKGCLTRQKISGRLQVFAVVRTAVLGTDVRTSLSILLYRCIIPSIAKTNYLKLNLKKPARIP